MSAHETKLSGNIQIGDYIILSEGNYLTTGFYIGRGKTGSFQFFTVNALVYWIDAKKDPNNHYGRAKRPYKSYINSPYITRISKYHPDCLSPEQRQDYEKAIEVLKLLNLR